LIKALRKICLAKHHIGSLLDATSLFLGFVLKGQGAVDDDLFPGFQAFGDLNIGAIV
jgi:hypothetical protein